MQKWADQLAGWLIKKGSIPPEDKELYAYAAFCWILALIPLFFWSIFSIWAGLFGEGLILVASFVCLHKFSGGYHSSSAIRCMILSCTLLSVFTVLTTRIVIEPTLCSILFAAVLFLAVNSPVDSKNRRLSNEELIAYKHVVQMLLALYVTAIFVLHCLSLDRYAVCIALGILLTALLQLPCGIKRVLAC